MGNIRYIKMIRVIIELQLIFPYKLSMGTLVDFCSLWDSTLLHGGTKKIKARFSMPLVHFKKIFGTNPTKKEYPVPSGMESFIESLRVRKILTK